VDEQGHEIGRPVDLSFTKAVAGAMVSAIVLFSLLFAAAHTARQNRGRAPSGAQNLLNLSLFLFAMKLPDPPLEKKITKSICLHCSHFSFLFY
jgi:F-type H+-transporting ATPase subunit a